LDFNVERKDDGVDGVDGVGLVESRDASSDLRGVVEASALDSVDFLLLEL
jgi:hypothetical protein